MLILIFPIGLPGVGKSKLSLELLEKLKQYKIFITCRDKLYQEAKRKGLSRSKTKKELEKELDNFITMVKTYHQKNMNKKVIVYMDSNNIFKTVRDKIIFNINPNKIIYLNFIVSKENILLLYQRLQERKGHPTFPTNKEDQERIVENISKGMEYEMEEEEKKIILNLSFTSNNNLDIVIEKI